MIASRKSSAAGSTKPSSTGAAHTSAAPSARPPEPGAPDLGRAPRGVRGKAPPAAQRALGRKAERREAQQQRRELRRRDRRPAREPGPEDPGREGLHPEMQHGPVIGDRLHHGECRAGRDRGPGDRQRDTAERLERADAEGARGLDQARRLAQEGHAAEQIDIRIKHEPEQQRRPRQRADLRKPVIVAPPAEGRAQPALDRAPIAQPVEGDIGDDIARHRHRQHQRPFECPPPRKLAGRHQPAGRDPDHHRQRRDEGGKQDRVAQIEGQHGFEQLRPDPLRGDEDMGEHRRDRQGHQRHHRPGHQEPYERPPVTVRGARRGQAFVHHLPGPPHHDGPFIDPAAGGRK